MSRSRNRRRGKGAAGTRGHRSERLASPSLSAFRAERQLDALAPALVRWFDDGSPDAASAALACLDGVKGVLTRYLERSIAAEVTGFEPDLFARAMADELTAVVSAPDAESRGAERGVFVLDAARAFVGFLAETGRWSGSVEQLDGVVDFLEYVAEEDHQPHYLDIPEIPDEEARAFFAGLPLIQRATALLLWIGDGRSVTSTGALRLRDIEAAAACVGVAARGATARARTADAVPTVRSMFDVPELAHIWSALESAELIRLTPTRVMPFEDSDHFLSGTASEQLDEFRVLTTAFLDQAVLQYGPDETWEKMLAGMQVSLLVGAASSDPPSLSRVLAAAENVPEGERAVAHLLTDLAMTRLHALAELGLLTVDTHLHVPRVLVGCVADVFDNDRVMTEFGLSEAPAAEDQRNPQPSAEAVETKPTPRSANGVVLQLKIALQGAKPPIWRRVLVPAEMPLPQLHTVIQNVFAWQDHHLHHFRTGGYRGPTYVPVSPDGEDDFYDEHYLDEADVTVGDLLPASGSTLMYTYDFGDDWKHAVLVEKVLTSDDGGQLSRCTAGRGRAPAEDSGGIWGWMNIVEAVNDPNHEEYEESREWLGLRSGEVLDPKGFNPAEVNENLIDLR